MPPKKEKKCPPPPKGGKKSEGAKGAPVSTAKTVKGQAGRNIRDQGTDYIGSFPAAASSKGIITQLVFSPTSLPRLGRLSSAFQRIRYHRLRFEIVSGSSSTVSGVYVAGFVKDVTDPVTASNASATLLASGGESVKFWQSTEVVVNGLPGLYYTSPSPTEPRWSAPGSFIIAVVSPPSQSLTLDVFVHWDVTLSQPTYESGSSDDGFITARVHAYTSKTNTYLSKRKGNDWEPLTPKDFVPPFPENGTMTLLCFRSASVQNSAGVLSGVFNFRQLRRDGEYIYPVDDKNTRSSQNFYDEDYVLFAGEKGSIDYPENLTRASWYHSPAKQSLLCNVGGCHQESPISQPENRSTSEPICTMPSSSTIAATIPGNPSLGKSSGCSPPSSQEITSLVATLSTFLAKLTVPPARERSTSQRSDSEEYDKCSIRSDGSSP